MSWGEGGQDVIGVELWEEVRGAEEMCGKGLELESNPLATRPKTILNNRDERGMWEEGPRKWNAF